MLRIENLHATVHDKPILTGLSLSPISGGVRKALGIRLEGSVG